MPHPGQYPNNPARGQAMTMEEFKPAPCACGEVRRRAVEYTKHMIHRLQPKIVMTFDCVAWLCVGCDDQVDTNGKSVPLDDPNRLDNKVLNKLL
jgi:hypothetical protein